VLHLFQELLELLSRSCQPRTIADLHHLEQLREANLLDLDVRGHPAFSAPDGVDLELLLCLAAMRALADLQMCFFCPRQLFI
jgi:hypothetical protein